MALEGSLQDMSLVDLFQVFRMGPKTGVLLLSSGPERGVIYVADGRPVDAVLVYGPERQVIESGEDAVIQLLQWEDASFTFRHDPAVRGRQLRILHDSDWLILEGMRRRKHSLHALSHQLTLETQLALSSLPSGIESGVNLSLDQWRILSQIANCQNLGEICQRTNMPVDGAIQIVTELIAIGLIEVVDVQPAAPRRSTTTTYTQNAFQHALAGVGALPHSAVAPASGRNLLHAIMRRIRGL
jgi:Domain of unknown function (DUF4388)